jgi:shikimate dehydrogenase
MTVPRACVIGRPIRHSRSPIIHGYWLKHYGLAGSYVREAVAPENLRDFLLGLSARGFVGCNVTIPHKEAAFEMVAVDDEATRRLKVVNTLYLSEGRLEGISTDGQGFIGSLRHSLPDWSPQNKRAVMLGAGGAARAIAGALIDCGIAELAIVNRSRERAEKLRDDFGAAVVVLDWIAAPDAMQDADLLVNTTSLGMAGQPELGLSLERLPASAIVTDIVYTPLQTGLLKAAQLRGHRTVPGLGMLLHQAVPGFARWFGATPEVTPELYRLVAADIEPPP